MLFKIYISVHVLTFILNLCLIYILISLQTPEENVFH